MNNNSKLGSKYSANVQSTPEEVTKISEENTSKNGSTRPPEPPREIIHERVIVEKEPEKRNGCATLGCGCRTIACGGCLLIIALIVAIVYVVAAKPPALWGIVVNFLNDDIHVPAYVPQPLDATQSQINSQIQTVGDTTITITQDQLTTLARNNIKNLQDIVVEIKPEAMRLYWKIDKTIPDNPLYGVIEVKVGTDGKLEISKIGTGRIGIPDFLNQTISGVVNSFLNIGGTGGNQSNGFLGGIIPSNSLNIKSVVLKDGVMQINASIKVDLFN